MDNSRYKLLLAIITTRLGADFCDRCPALGRCRWYKSDNKKGCFDTVTDWLKEGNNDA